MKALEDLLQLLRGDAASFIFNPALEDTRSFISLNSQPDCCTERRKLNRITEQIDRDLDRAIASSSPV
jgi:hypothetical protein